MKGKGREEQGVRAELDGCFSGGFAKGASVEAEHPVRDALVRCKGGDCVLPGGVEDHVAAAVGTTGNVLRSAQGTKVVALDVHGFQLGVRAASHNVTA